MKQLIILLIGIVFILASPVTAAAETIEKINVEGHKKISIETVRFYMKSSPNGVYSETALRRDFKALWETGFFENITITSEPGLKGHIVTVSLVENPIIASITYKAGKKIKRKDIEDRLRESNISLTALSYFDPSRGKRAERAIRAMLKEKGYNDGRAAVISQAAPGGVQLTVTVEPGYRTRIGVVEFPGLDLRRISSAFLVKAMKNNKPHTLFSAIGGKDVFTQKKISEDLDHIRLRLQQKGYLEAKVGSPALSYFKKANVLGKRQNMLKISIPVDMGPRYTVGDVSISGNKVVKTAYLDSLVTLKKGKVYNVKKRNKLVEDISKMYRTLSYVYCQVAPVENLDPVRKVADLKLTIREGDRAYVGKLAFSGNTFTRDKVLRREWLLREGQPLNMSALENSITRMKQLGLVSIDKAPEFKPRKDDPQKVDISVNVNEVQRQAIAFNLGANGYEGLFLGLSYSTQNFMGRGETLALNLQTGTKTNRYSLSFTKPHLFDLPANFGAGVFKTSVEYPELTTNSAGFNVSVSGRVKGFWTASLGYKYQEIRSTADFTDGSLMAAYSAFYNYSGRESSISPSIYYSSIDSPIFPTRGGKLSLGYRFSGGPLGGDINLHKLRLQLVRYVPLRKNHVLGFQLVVQGMMPFGGGPVPIWEKYRLGENSIRGFGPYSITPRDARGNALGGTKAFFANAQYEWALNQTFSTILFFDMGNAYDTGQPFSLNNVYSSMGVELKVFVPMLNVPFRLIFAYNPRTLTVEEPHFQFRFTVGTSFQ